MNERAVLAALIVSPLFAGPCEGEGSGGDARVLMGDETIVIEGEVHHAERISLPPGATLRVVAEERSGDRSRTLAQAKRQVSGSPPYAFTLGIDEAEMEDPRAVVLRAEIHAHGALTFSSEEPERAFDGDQPRRDVVITVRPRGGA